VRHPQCFRVNLLTAWRKLELVLISVFVKALSICSVAVSFLFIFLFTAKRILEWIWMLSEYFFPEILKELLDFLILRRIAFCSQQNCRFVPTVSFTPMFQYHFTYVGLSGTHRGGFLEICFKTCLRFLWGSKFCMYLLWGEMKVNASTKKTTDLLNLAIRFKIAQFLL